MAYSPSCAIIVPKHMIPEKASEVERVRHFEIKYELAEGGGRYHSYD